MTDRRHRDSRVGAAGFVHDPAAARAANHRGPGRLRWPVAAAFLAAVLAVVVPRSAPATDFITRPYDYLILALSWSPSYCELAAEDADPEQCGQRGPEDAFIVHGLWPQSSRGELAYCGPAGKLDPKLVDSMLDLTPSRDLIAHEWAKHGTCSGLPPDLYFRLVRQAYEVVRVPPDLQELYTAATVSPPAIERMFTLVNPGLGNDEISISCRMKRLTEVRFCLDSDLGFVSCPEQERRACRQDWVRMPPVTPSLWGD